MKEKRALIFGGGTLGIDPGSVLREYDRVICADGGYNHALRFGIQPDLVIGDMDSVSGRIDTTRTVTYPVRKDFTDGELVMDYVLSQGIGSMILLGFTGTRMDHTITNITMMRKAARRGISCVILDANNEIYYITQMLHISGKKGDLVSIIPLGADMTGVTTHGLEYPLSGETLYYGQSRGVSNVMTGETCDISIEKGEGIVTKSRD